MPHQSAPTDEQLRAAWRQLARPGWPSLEEIRAAALQFAQLRAFAMGESARQAVVHRPEVVPPAGATAPARYGSLRMPRGPVPIDRKRAAAGERDED